MSSALPQHASLTSDAKAASRPEAPPPSPADQRDPLSRQQAVVAMGRRAVAPPDLSILMQDAATLIAEMLGVEHSCVAELAPDGSQIVHALTLQAADSAEPQVWAQESGADGNDSLAGYAIEVAHPVVVANLPQETRFSDLFLQKHGVLSAIAIPLALQDRSFGALVACSSQARAFHREDVLFVETVAHLITTTIARIRTEKALAEQRRLSAEVLQTVGAMVLVLDAEGRISSVNRVSEKVTGFSSGEVENRPIGDVFIAPGEADFFQKIFARLREGVWPVECESLLLTKHSQQRRIAWSCAATSGPDGSIESIILTGIDVTAKWHAEEKAAQAQRALDLGQSATDERPSAPFGGDQGGPMSGSEASVATQDKKAHALDILPGPINSDRRRRQRRSYPYRQWVAPILGGTLPDESEFIEVECNDIAPGGVSFLSPRAPQSEVLVVALGTPPKLTYLTAQVVHVTRIERKGRRMYLVGCTYIGRAAY